MIGRAISHYRVLSALGSGGMGVVYLAEDERLGRQVALKFLPPDSARNRQALDRFRVEARAASSLSHPGICAIYDIGEDEGTPFIVMEALRGETLRDRINKGPIKVAELLEIGIQLADALEAAHSQGIIHRDIKPSNIFVGEKNRVKILDFGLAKLSANPTTGPDGRTVDASTHQTVVKQITIPGSALGTVSYMSPEQARGEDVDTRTDLFSLGAVLYEMATGTQAFGGSTPAVVFDQILNHTPPVLANLNPLVPPRLEVIIGTLLEKDRDLRYQHASDLQAELKRLRRDLDSGTLMGISGSRSVSATAAPKSAPKVAPQPASVRSWRYGIAALAVLVLGAVAFTIWSGRSAGTPSPSSDRAVTTIPSAPAAPTAAAAPAQAEPAPGAPLATAATPPPRATTPAAVQPQPGPRSVPISPPTEPRAAGTPARGTTAPAPPVQREPVPPASAQTAQAAPVPPPPAAAPAPAPAPVTPAAAAVETPPAAPVSPPPPQAQPAPPRAAEPSPAQSAPRAAASDAPAAAVESDEAAIRRVVATYKTAIETKSVTLFRSVRPGLSAAEETRLRDSFRQVDSQQISIAIDEIRVDGRAATARISRQDVITSAGRRQTQSSRQTLRFEKSATGWIITSIGG